MLRVVGRLADGWLPSLPRLPQLWSDGRHMTEQIGRLGREVAPLLRKATA